MVQIYRDYIVSGGEIIDIFVDSAAELPSGGIIGDKKAALGSSAIDVSTGNEYRINSSGRLPVKGATVSGASTVVRL